MLLIAGGERDPNVTSLCDMAAQEVVSFEPLLFGEQWPVLSWDLARDEFRVGSRLLQPSAVFLRHDVFSILSNPHPRIERAALAWFAAIEGWTTSHPGCLTLNADMCPRLNKPFALRVAESVGLAVPRTVVTNDLERILEASQRFALVAKPVAGGDYCHAIETVAASEDAQWIHATPTIVQERLEAPEVRIYRVGDTLLPFQVDAPTLDYRMTSDCRIQPFDEGLLPEGVKHGLRRLTDQLGLDFAAADFKSCPVTGDLLFLEVNTQPMFAAFDAVSDNAVSRAILRLLSGA